MYISLIGTMVTSLLYKFLVTRFGRNFKKILNLVIFMMIQY